MTEVLSINWKSKLFYEWFSYECLCEYSSLELKEGQRYAWIQNEIDFEFISCRERKGMGKWSNYIVKWLPLVEERMK